MNWHNFRALLPDDKHLQLAFDEYEERDLHERVTTLIFTLIMHELFDSLPRKSKETEPEEFARIALIAIISTLAEQDRLDPLLRFMNDERLKRLSVFTAARAAIDSASKPNGHTDKETMDFFMRAASQFTDYTLTEMKKQRVSVRG